MELLFVLIVIFMSFKYDDVSLVYYVSLANDFCTNIFLSLYF